MKKIILAVILFYPCFIKGITPVMEENQFLALKEQKNSIAKLLLDRYSGRSYDPKKQVSEDNLLSILEAGSLAPSCYNNQPWVFIVCDKNKDPKAYQKAFSTLVEANQKWVENAPILILSIADSFSAKGNKFNRWSEYDTGAAAFSMMLEATSLGLMPHQMGGFNQEKVVEEFSLPETLVPMSVMALGYATEDDVPPQKKRKSLSENFYLGSLQIPFN